MNVLIILLRAVHIVAGVFWVGGSVLTSFFIAPAADATADSGRKFFAYLVRNMRFTQRFAAAAGVTVLAGAILYWIDSAGLTANWIRSGPGLGFGIGALFALVGMLLGVRVGILTRRIVGIAAAIQGGPTQGQVLQLDSAQRQVYVLRRIQDTLLVIALACMATARYWAS